MIPAKDQSCGRRLIAVNGRVSIYSVYGCWVSEITSLPVDGAGDAFAIQSITLQNEGWDSV